eukprot:12783909-Heterocapsa_arctica.AAC.1
MIWARAKDLGNGFDKSRPAAGGFCHTLRHRRSIGEAALFRHTPHSIGEAELFRHPPRSY